MAILEALSKSQFYASCYTLLDLEILCLKKEKKHVIKSCLFISKNKLLDTIRSLQTYYLWDIQCRKTKNKHKVCA